MTTPAYTTLVEDICQHLATLKVGTYTATGVYPTGTQWPIYRSRIPDEAATGISVVVYGDDRFRDQVTADILVQIRVRGTKNPDVTNAKADSIFELLNDEAHLTLNNRSRVLHCTRHLRTPEEPDTNQRWNRADSYTFTVNP